MDLMLLLYLPLVPVLFVLWWTFRRVLARFQTEKIQYIITLGTGEKVKSAFTELDPDELDGMMLSFHDPENVNYIDLVDEDGYNVILTKESYQNGYLTIKTKMRF